MSSPILNNSIQKVVITNIDGSLPDWFSNITAIEYGHQKIHNEEFFEGPTYVAAVADETVINTFFSMYEE